MECAHPQYICKDGVHWFWSNCGKCPNCKKMKVNELTIRMRHELAEYKENTFLTLTYAPEFLPISRKSFGAPKDDCDIVRGEQNSGIPTLFKRDVQLYFKSLRQAIKPARLRLFYCGEYGGLFHRPHYHCILFGVSPDDERIGKFWQYGFIDAKPATIGRCRYTAKYLLKDAIYSPEFCYSHGLQSQFHQASNRPGLGGNYVSQHMDELLEELSVFERGKKVPLPRYYFKKLKEQDETISERIAQKNNEFLTKKFACTPRLYEEYKKKHDVFRLHQLEKNIKAEIALKGI